MYQIIPVIFALLATSSAIPVDNEVIGEPEIECSADHVLVNFNTRNLFEGHTYVKGHYMADGCRRDATNSRSASIQVGFNSCGVRRQRSLNPAGLFVIATVVISFHPQFVTKVDRAYNVKCFYMETDKTVTSELGVSMLTTAMLTQNVPMPVCRYEVRRDNTEGEVVRFARIGDKVFHRWTCGTETVDIFCMTVHSCFVDNGQDFKVQLLDENGCAQDKYLLQNVLYTHDLTGGQETHVFKFADKPTLFFNCQIRLTLKEGGVCQRTSDNCGVPSRGKRMAEPWAQLAEGANVDVYTDDIMILSDIGENLTEKDLSTELNLLRDNRISHHDELSSPDRIEYIHDFDSTSSGGLTTSQARICLTRTSFSILLAALCLILALSVSFTIACCYRQMRVADKVAPAKSQQLGY